MSRIGWLLGLAALALGMAWWWLRPVAGPAAGDSDVGEVVATAATVESAGAADSPAIVPASPAAPPNSATARWAAELQRPGATPVKLPYPIDDSLDPEAARALYRKSREVVDCYTARASLDTEAWELRTGTRWLDAAERQRVLAGLREARRRQQAVCQRHGLDPDDADAPPPATVPYGFVTWARTSAAASGDPAAHLEHSAFVRRRPDISHEIRPLMRQLLAGDADDLPLVARIYERGARDLPLLVPLNSRQAQSYAPLPNFDAIWTLVGCDRGMDCGGTSLSADRLCLIRGLCGYPDVETAVRDGLIGESELETAMQARVNIVAALRRGDVDAIVGRGP
jgi:hypothetical protein